MTKKINVDKKVVFDHNTATLNFYSSDLNIDNNGETIYFGDFNSISIPWVNYNKIVEKVIFDKSFNNSDVTSLNSWFYNAYHLCEVEGLENIPWYQVDDISNMFSGCCSLEHIDISYFNNKDGYKFAHIFKDCYLLEDVKLFKTDISKHFNSLFKNCISLEKVIV